MAAKFEIRSPKTGEYRWVLTSQGRTLAIGPTYARRALAEKSIDTFRSAAVAAPVDDQAPTRGKATPAKAAPVKRARVARRAATESLVTAGPMDTIEQGLAQLDATVAEIRKVAARAGGRVAKKLR